MDIYSNFPNDLREYTYMVCVGILPKDIMDDEKDLITVLEINAETVSFRENDTYKMKNVFSENVPSGTASRLYKD